MEAIADAYDCTNIYPSVIRHIIHEPPAEDLTSTDINWRETVLQLITLLN
jgi:hypothetical protein